MIGLMAIVVLGGLLALACWVFVWAYRAKRRQGKSDAVSFAWAMCAVIVLYLPITWDAIPTWIAFNYYADKEAGVKVFKTLQQWKAENPGVADALQPYGFNEKRSQAKNIGNNKVRRLINERFAYDSHNFDRLFLSVYARRYALVDLENDIVLVTYVEVGSGNSGGLASGGPGWWAFWLIHKPTKSGVGVWSSYVQSVEKMGAKKDARSGLPPLIGNGSKSTISRINRLTPPVDRLQQIEKCEMGDLTPSNLTRGAGDDAIGFAWRRTA